MGIKRVKGAGFGGIRPGESNKRAQPRDLVDMVELEPEFRSYRCVGDPIGVMTHRVTIETPKGEFQISKQALNYDPELDQVDNTIKDPYTEIPNPVSTVKHYFINVIDRVLQDNEPRKRGKPSKEEKRSGFKTKGSEVWTPVRVLRITERLAREIQKIRELNKHKVKGKKVSCDVTDDKYGCDIYILFDKDAKSATDMYKIQKGDPSPLTDEEKEYLMWDLSHLYDPEPYEVAKKEAENLAKKAPESDEDDDEDDDDDLPKKSKKSKKSSSSSKKRRRDDDDDSRSSKKSSSKKRRRDDDDDDEDEKPKKKKKSSSSKDKSGKKKVKRSSL